MNIAELRKDKDRLLEWANANISGRNLLVLTRVLNGETHAAVAESLGINLDAVRNDVAKCVRIMRHPITGINPRPPA